MEGRWPRNVFHTRPMELLFLSQVSIAAFEAALKQLKVVDRKARMALLVAKTTLQIAKEGERDPERLSERVIRLGREACR
jgi:hypothetical protein